MIKKIPPINFFILILILNFLTLTQPKPKQPLFKFKQKYFPQ